MTQHIMEQQGQDSEVLTIVDEITGTLQRAFDILIKRRDETYADAIVPLNAERESLAEEHAAISEAARNLELVLPAKARIAQYEADQLTVSGKSEEAKAKLEEMETARNAPALMRARQQQIADRIDEIVKEKQDAARSIFHEWLEAEVCLVARAGERAYFKLLREIEASCDSFQAETGTGSDIFKPGSRGLFHWGNLLNLTGTEHSEEWATARRWYGGGR